VVSFAAVDESGGGGDFGRGISLGETGDLCDDILNDDTTQSRMAKVPNGVKHCHCPTQSPE